MLKRILLAVAIALLLALVAVWAAYRRDMRRAYARVQGASSVLPSPYGNIEYTQGGTGPAVLVIHGSGGGFDQGELVARAALGDGFHWIAPSRFGYLRSTFHAGATFDDQAHAYAHLLDHLGIDKAAVLALSHGGPSALLFAVLHPERVSSLTLISAGVASSTDSAQAQANRQGDALKTIFERDLTYWTLTRAARKRFLTIMGASPEVAAGLTPEQRQLVDQLIDFMNPVSLRSAGAAFDNQAAMPNERIAAIRAPTLILHAEDDTLQLVRHAEVAAATIPGAERVRFERGGHLLLAVEQTAIRTRVREHVLAHAQRP
ncbi:MAG TPA: alpha/beta hydrolase [Thermoanaerobaculia bacterium]|nr:alpha/beta hydrolase [Thermoanaerobaculia bacterium]